MRKVLYLFVLAFLFAVCSWSAEATDSTNHGVRAKVELVTGTTQNAQFLGLAQDTVLLGGNIQGKFTIIRITRDRFKSIVDEAGNDLLNPVPVDSAVVKPLMDTLAYDTAKADSSLKDSATFLDSIEGKNIFVALERRSIDSALDVQVTPIIKQLLHESGAQFISASRTDFGYCRDLACIRDSLMQYKAASAYFGRIVVAQSEDSLVLQMSHIKFPDSVRVASVTLSALRGLSSALEGDRLTTFVKELEGTIEPKQTKTDSTKVCSKNGVSYVKVETDPEGSNIAVAGKGEVCKSPCTFAVKDTAKFDIYAYWNVNGQMWATKKTVLPISGDTAKYSLKLKKVRPTLHVFTIPEGASLYAGSEALTPSSKSDGESPETFDIYEPGESFIQIRKEGYRDTLVKFYASPMGATDLSVTLKPIANPIELELQKEWVKNQKKNFIGHVLMGSSVAPIIAGAILAYLANCDYDDAKQIKNELALPATPNGSNYQARVDKNHDLVHSGNRKMIVGGSLVGAGLVMLGIGFSLTF